MTCLSFRRAFRLALILAFGGLIVGLSGCGRRATAADCGRMIDRMVEIQYKAMHPDASSDDPEELRVLTERVRTEFAARVNDCVGRRASATLLKCFDESKTLDEVQACAR